MIYLYISRLDKLGVRNCLLSWLFSYVDLGLNKKKITILLFLEVFFCYSLLFLILFLVFINDLDLVKCLKSCNFFLSFAEDKNIFVSMYTDDGAIALN